MNNLNEALIDIAKAAFVKNGHPDFAVYQTPHSFGHWQVDYKKRKPGQFGSLLTAVFAEWEETEARAYYEKKLVEYLLD